MVAHQIFSFRMIAYISSVAAEIPIVIGGTCTVSCVEILVKTACVMKHRSMSQYLPCCAVIRKLFLANQKAEKKHTLTMCGGVQLTVGHIEADTAVHEISSP